MKIDITFEQYIKEVKKCVVDNKIKRNQIGRNIRGLSIDDDFINANILYFKDQYEGGYTPENVLDQIETDTNELYIRMNDVSDDYFIDEVNNRNLGRYCIEDVSTTDLEEELDRRYDTSYRNIYNMSRDEILDILNIDEGDIIDHDLTLKDIICKALGFSNSFAYSTDEIINEIKKRLNK